MPRKLRMFWYRLDKATLAGVLFLALVAGVLASAAGAVFNQRDAKRAAVREFHARSIDCLARNIYYESRGEPLAGQYAVAEVTMNRRASPLYPKTVCEVVFQNNWDPLRKRYVGAFSWTEFEDLDEPAGEAWQLAVAVAEDTYYRRRAPALAGVLYFHADWAKPEWAKERKRVARIGHHVFYR